MNKLSMVNCHTVARDFVQQHHGRSWLSFRGAASNIDASGSGRMCRHVKLGPSVIPSTTTTTRNNVLPCDTMPQLIAGLLSALARIF